MPRAAVMAGPGAPIEVRELPAPDIEPGGILLQTIYSEVCGTDVHLHHGRLAGVPYPIIPGHVSVGRVVDTGGRIEDAHIGISSHTNRVPVEHGHTIVMSVELAKKTDVGAVENALRSWRGASEACGLPSSPERVLAVTDQADRPQPRRDVDSGRGMTVTVGRIRRDPMFDVRLVALGHNIVRGAAGASVLNAELMAATGRFEQP